MGSKKELNRKALYKVAGGNDEEFFPEDEGLNLSGKDKKDLNKPPMKNHKN